MSHITRMTMIGLYRFNDSLFDKMTLPEEIDQDDFINSFLLKYGECPVLYPDWDFMQFALGAWSRKWYDSINRIITAFKEEYNPLHNFDRHEIYTDTEDIDKTGSSETDKKSNATNNSAKNTEANSTNTHTATNTSETNSRTNEDRETDTYTDRRTEDESTVSAFNEDDYQPDRKNNISETVNGNETVNGTVTGSTTGRDTVNQNETGKDTLKDTVQNSLNSSDNEKTNLKDNTDRKLNHTGHLYGNIGVTESTTMLLHEKELREKYNIIDIVCDMLFKEVCIYIY